MKLVIQIPCFNERDHIHETLAGLPRELPGFDAVEWIIIDDGSTDGTAELVEDLVDEVVRLPRNRGLAAAFRAGLDACLRRGADVIVNTDADNQYDARDIKLLVGPIVDHRADVVVGARPIVEIPHFSWSKKRLQRLGSAFVRWASSTDVPDAPSGFRALSREAAMRMNVFNDYTYTLETLVQAGQNGLSVTSVPIRVNGETRPSRLISSIPRYVMRSVETVIRSFVTYRPFRSFAVPGTLAFLIGFALGVRFLIFYVTGSGGGHVQSLILAALLLGIGFFLGVIGIVVDLIAVNRKLLEQLNYRIQAVEYGTRGDFQQSAVGPSPFLDESVESEFEAGARAR